MPIGRWTGTVQEVEPNEDEEECVEKIGECLPDGKSWAARACPEGAGLAATTVHPHDHHGQHGRDAERSCGEVGGVWDEKRKGDHQRYVVETSKNSLRQDPCGQPDRESSDREDDQADDGTSKEEHT